MELQIDAFTSNHKDEIPKKYTCDGEEQSPCLQWGDVPSNVKSFALVMEALDVPHRSNPLVLWVVYNIPGDVRKIATNTLPKEALVGTNDLGKIGYSGPCPKPGSKHERYHIVLFALDIKLDLVPGATEYDLTRAMKGHILDTGEEVAVHERCG